MIWILYMWYGIYYIIYTVQCTIYIICKFQRMCNVHYVTFYILYNMGFVSVSACVCMNTCVCLCLCLCVCVCVYVCVCV